MEPFVQNFVHQTAIVIEGAAAVIVALAVLRAILVSFLSLYKPEFGPLEIRFTMGRWLALALEFLLAADIIQTAVAPTWDEIGKLAAIVVLRTSLNFFLEREIRAGHTTEEVIADDKSARQPGGATHGQRDLAPGLR